MNWKQANKQAQQRQQEMLAAVESTLQDGSNSMASNACLSRYHFQRVFERAVGESPGALRRRLLLERAAYELRTTKMTITRIAFDAEYRTHEGFTRAFKQAFGLSPCAYRQAAQQIRFLPGSSGVHYNHQTRSLLTTLPGGKRNMDLIDRLLEGDYVAKRRILECARLLSDGQLDAPLAFRNKVVRWVEPPRTLRETLIHLFGDNSEMNQGGWVGEMQKSIGWEPEGLPAPTENSPAAWLERLEISCRVFRDFVHHVRANNLWDQEWVDTSCEPPETFAIGGVISETLTSSIAQRRILEIMMEQMGFQLH